MLALENRPPGLGRGASFEARSPEHSNSKCPISQTIIFSHLGSKKLHEEVLPVKFRMVTWELPESQPEPQLPPVLATCSTVVPEFPGVQIGLQGRGEQRVRGGWQRQGTLDGVPHEDDSGVTARGTRTVALSISATCSACSAGAVVRRDSIGTFD